MRHRGIAIVCQVQVTAVQPFDFFRTIRQADFFCLAFAGWWLLGRGGVAAVYIIARENNFEE